MQSTLNSSDEATIGHGGTRQSNFLAGRRRLRIMHLISSLQVGGMEHFVLRIAGEQRRRGHQATILALQGGPLHEQAQMESIPVKVLGGSSRVLRLVRGALHTAWLRPDIAHAHNPSSLHYGVLARLAGNARVVMTYHGQGKGDARVPSVLERRCTDAVVAVSEDTARHVRVPYGAARLTVIYNGIDPPLATRSREEVRAELGLGNWPVGIIVARIDGLKGHDCLLRALALLRAGAPQMTLLVAGDGPERVRIEHLARHLELGPEVVRFLGYRADVPDLLAAADFFVLPSVTEGLPLSVLEAMAHRLPVVVTPVGGLPEVTADGRHGLFVPVNDPDALVRAIARLASEPALRRSLGNAAYQRVRDAFSFRSMLQQYDDLYYDLLARPRDRQARQ